MENVLDRAKRNSLTTDNVIYRAVNPYTQILPIDGCSELQSIYKIDIKAADEVKTTNEALLKLSAAASESSRRNLDGVSPEVLKESYSVGRLVEQRIRERATLINLKPQRVPERLGLAGVQLPGSAPMNVRHIRPLDAVARREYHLYLPAASPSERQTEDASHAETRSTMGTNRQFSTRHSFIASSCLSVRPKMISSVCVNVNIDLCK